MFPASIHPALQATGTIRSVRQDRSKLALAPINTARATPAMIMIMKNSFISTASLYCQGQPIRKPPANGNTMQRMDNRTSIHRRGEEGVGLDRFSRGVAICLFSTEEVYRMCLTIVSPKPRSASRCCHSYKKSAYSPIGLLILHW